MEQEERERAEYPRFGVAAEEGTHLSGIGMTQEENSENEDATCCQETHKALNEQ